MKGFDERGLVFYTNYQSSKGEQLEEKPKAAIAFWWGELERQVRIEGTIEKVAPEESTSILKVVPSTPNWVLGYPTKVKLSLLVRYWRRDLSN